MYEEPTQSEVESLVDTVSEEILKRGLEAPAILFLESHKPVSFVANQASIVFSPFLMPILGPKFMNAFAKISHDRRNVELLIQRLEEGARNRRVQAKEATSA